MQPWCSSSGSTASSAGRGRSVSSCFGGGRSCGSWPSGTRSERKLSRSGGRWKRRRGAACAPTDALRSGSSLPPGFHFLHESLGETAAVGGALQGSPQIGMERWDRRIDLDGPGERSERVLVPTLTDVHLGQVVHRPGVPLVEYDRLLERFDRAGGIAQLALHPAEQAVTLIRG